MNEKASQGVASVLEASGLIRQFGAETELLHLQCGLLQLVVKEKFIF